MTSKFFAEDNEPSDHGSNEIVSEEEEEKKQQVKKVTNYFSESSEEEEGRRVKTEKEKRHDAIKEVIEKIKEKMKIKDFGALLDRFDDLNKQLEKAKKVVDKEGVPIFYVRICWALENLVNSLNTEDKKALKPANAKAYSSLKHNLKKNNKKFEKEISEFAKNPVFSEQEETKVEKKEKKPKAPKDSKAKGDDNADESSDELEGEGALSSASSSSDEDERQYLQSDDPQVRRKYWLKKVEESEEDEETAEQKAKIKQIKQQKRLADKARKQEDAERQREINRSKEKEVMTQEQMDKKIRDIVERRAGKKTSTKEKRVSVDDDLDVLNQVLKEIHGDPTRRLEALLVVMPTRIDASKQITSAYMPRYLWLQNYENLVEFFNIIKKGENISNIRTFQKDLETYFRDTSILESFSTHFEGLDNELYKAFKNVEPTSIEYVERLRDQALMSKLASQALEYFSAKNDIAHEIKFAYKKVEYLYYIKDSTYEKLKNKNADEAAKVVDAGAAAPTQLTQAESDIYRDKDIQETIHKLAVTVYKNSKDEKLITKTMLYQIYNHAINGRYQTAKDYLLMSHVQENCQNSDTQTQILYNRVLVQFGLCAFRHGYIQEALNALSEMVAANRIRELLAQGLSRNPVNEKEERRRILPYHYHIPIEVVEAVHLICAMLIEIPIIAADPTEASKKTRFFRKMFEQTKNFYGPPDSYRDYILVAGKELHQGNWKKCYNHLVSIPQWNKITENEKTKTNLISKVKEQSLKCYLFTLQSCYESLSVAQLAKAFELEKESLHSIISKLIFSKELKGFLDLDSECLIFEKVQNTKFQTLGLQLSDKVAAMLVSNERNLDAKFGNYGYTDKDIPEGLVNKKKTTQKKRPGAILNTGKGKRGGYNKKL